MYYIQSVCQCICVCECEFVYADKATGKMADKEEDLGPRWWLKTTCFFVKEEQRKHGGAQTMCL